MKPTACGNLILRYEISFAGDFVEYFPLILSIGINQKINPPQRKKIYIFKRKYYMFTTMFYLGHMSQVFA